MYLPFQSNHINSKASKYATHEAIIPNSYWKGKEQNHYHEDVRNTVNDDHLVDHQPLLHFDPDQD